MAVRIEPPAALFPPVYITATSSIIIKFTETENKRKKLVFRDENEMKHLENAPKFDIYDAEERKNSRPITRYDSSIFSFDSDEILLWPKGTSQILLTFRPKIAQQYEKTIYICTEDNSFVYPYKIVGKGLPPLAHFVTDCIQIGHVGLDSVLDYEVEFANYGSVGVDFELQQKPQNGFIFEFEPSKGHLNVDERLKIHVRFIASSVGPFNEIFTFHIAGALTTHPTITFSGKVIGPSFQITPRVLNFGNVGFGFLYSKKITIENKSEIPFDFQFHLKAGQSQERREYQFIPQTGHVDKFST